MATQSGSRPIHRNYWQIGLVLGIAALVGSLTGLAIVAFRASSGGGNGGPQAAVAALKSPSPSPTQPATTTQTVPGQHGVTTNNTASTPTPSPTAKSKPATQPPRTIVPEDTPTEAAPPPADDQPPTEGRWIDVNVSGYTVTLMDGTSPVQVIGPVAVGAQIDTGAYESTATGLFHVYSKNAALTYDAPYDTYISDWVGFDPALANGFHSFLKDKDGNVVDSSTGNVSNGCIRTPDPDAIYAFAQIGMPVYVHT